MSPKDNVSKFLPRFFTSVTSSLLLKTWCRITDLTFSSCSFTFWRMNPLANWFGIHFFSNFLAVTISSRCQNCWKFPLLLWSSDTKILIPIFFLPVQAACNNNDIILVWLFYFHPESLNMKQLWICAPAFFNLRYNALPPSVDFVPSELSCSFLGLHCWSPRFSESL